MIGKNVVLSTVAEKGSNKSTGYKDSWFRGVLLRYLCFRNTEKTSKIVSKGNVWNRGASIKHPSTKYDITETKGMEGNKTEQWTLLYRLLQEKKNSMGRHLEKIFRTTENNTAMKD